MANTINHAKRLALRMYPLELIRFLNKVERNKRSGCWVWTGYKDENGYGQFKTRGRAHWAHRISFATFVRKIPKRKQVDHTCRNPSCVNPDHLCLLDHGKNANAHKKPFDHYIPGKEGWDEPKKEEAPF